VGSELKRTYQGRLIVVRVAEDGFLYKDQTPRLAERDCIPVTGTRWNGFLFFRLQEGQCMRGWRCPALRHLHAQIYRGGAGAELQLLHATEAAEAYIQSQRQAGWVALREQYDDGGCTAAT
jgi:hypothetical protein